MPLTDDGMAVYDGQNYHPNKERGMNGLAILGLVAFGVFAGILRYHYGRFHAVHWMHFVVSGLLWMWSATFDWTLSKLDFVRMDDLTLMIAVGISLWAWIFLVSLVMAYAKPKLHFGWYIVFAVFFAIFGLVSVGWTTAQLMQGVAIAYSVGVIIALWVRRWVQKDNGTPHAGRVSDTVLPVINLHPDSGYGRSDGFFDT